MNTVSKFHYRTKNCVSLISNKNVHQQTSSWKDFSVKLWLHCIACEWISCKNFSVQFTIAVCWQDIQAMYTLHTNHICIRTRRACLGMYKQRVGYFCWQFCNFYPQLATWWSFSCRMFFWWRYSSTTYYVDYFLKIKLLSFRLKRPTCFDSDFWIRSCRLLSIHFANCVFFNSFLFVTSVRKWHVQNTLLIISSHINAFSICLFNAFAVLFGDKFMNLPISDTCTSKFV